MKPLVPVLLGCDAERPPLIAEVLARGVNPDDIDFSLWRLAMTKGAR